MKLFLLTALLSRSLNNCSCSLRRNYEDIKDPLFEQRIYASFKFEKVTYFKKKCSNVLYNYIMKNIRSISH